MSDPVRPDLDALENEARLYKALYSPCALSPAETLALIAYARTLEAHLEAYRDRQARYEDALEARTLAIPVVRHSERERCAAHVDAYADALLRNGGHGLGTQISYVAHSIRALPDREESDA